MLRRSPILRMAAASSLASDWPRPVLKEAIMKPQALAVPLLAMLLTVSACETPESLGPAPKTPLFANAPSDGSGNKQVFVVNIGPTNFSCGTETIVRNITGWTQVIFD